MCSPIEIQSVKAHSESGWYPCRVHLLLAQQTESNSGCDPHSISQDSRKCPKLVYLSVARSSLRFAKKELCHLKIVFFVSIDVLYLYICIMLLFCIITGLQPDFNEVYLTTIQFSAKWEDIGSRLGIAKPTIDIIARDNSSVTGCMSAMIASWLKRESPGQRLPTWRNMCTAIASVDLTTAESIAAAKGFRIMPTGRLYNYVNAYANYICFLN